MPDDPVDRFLDQPARHYDEDVDRPVVPSTRNRRVGLWARLNRFLFDKQPSGYSSIAPRTADGRRTKPFFFNGSGKGR